MLDCSILHSLRIRWPSLIGQVCGLAARQAHLSKATPAPPFSSKPRLIDEKTSANSSQSRSSQAKARKPKNVRPNVQTLYGGLLSKFDLLCSFELWRSGEQHPAASFLSAQRSGHRCWRRYDQQQSCRHHVRPILQRQLRKRDPGNAYRGRRSKLFFRWMVREL